MEMNKARNMLEHREEIFSRPPRTWIQQGSSSSGSSRLLGKRPPGSQPPTTDLQSHNKKTKRAKKPAKEDDVSQLFTLSILAVQLEFRTCI